MKTLAETKLRFAQSCPLAVIALVLLLTASGARGGGVVTSCTEANLRALWPVEAW